MRLNHLDLAVPDVALARDFFTSHFGLHHRETLGRDGLAILADDGGLVLVLSRWRKQGAAAYPDGFHIGFLVETREEVDAQYEHLAAAGVEVQPPSAMRGGWMFYLTGPGGVLIEVSWRPAPAGD
ncbi:catechol 2,3-dioxygenase-like lactoylglutathione lyase family enzyme [Inquilinus ginsengisoli]|uniref:Catechol 2,3-dioxygenase-like lactoylglutathione lyase family enzyme n=1 Tax=Inquilinus ginsengisoli TaxID=363840 RepID=A0ABU1JG33_9PROT|nr:VOC family protein [Inquilinus ginsengisoli]MDR6287582.1 catechol 2,3-dioxygenase-like lactoylglutathione lyase family enzyme [Inquilinus ginsengisoli]